ncbi:MAG: ArsR family transcriptional regulator [Thermoplasmata archaeon]|nr:ArsR family transcriptional regulator [Thermoplasmata archaeon]
MDCREVMQCIFDISDGDIQIYKYLLGKEMKADKIAEKFRKDRSTIQRSLKKLIECGLVKRQKKIIGRGGYYYTYTSITKEDAKNLIKVCLDDWYNDMTNAIKNLEKEFE